MSAWPSKLLASVPPSRFSSPLPTTRRDVIARLMSQAQLHALPSCAQRVELKYMPCPVPRVGCPARASGGRSVQSLLWSHAQRMILVGQVAANTSTPLLSEAGVLDRFFCTWCEITAKGRRSLRCCVTARHRALLLSSVSVYLCSPFQQRDRALSHSKVNGFVPQTVRVALTGAHEPD